MSMAILVSPIHQLDTTKVVHGNASLLDSPAFTKLAKVLNNEKELSEVLSKSKNWTTLVWT
jgi:hypothetical protein